MSARTLVLVTLALGLSAAWGCEEADRRPVVRSDSSGSGGTAGKGGSSANAAGGDGNDSGGESSGGGGESAGMGGENAGSGASGGQGPSSGGSAGTNSSAGAPGDIEVDLCESESALPPSLTSTCDVGATWGAGSELVLSGGDVEQFIGITPDELSIAWFSAGGADGVTLVADRASVGDDFDAPQEVALSSVVALSPDGLRLVGIAAGNGAFREATRATRDDAFGEPGEGSFSTINADALENGLSLNGAVISPDDQTLYYYAASLAGAEDYPLRVSKRSDTGPWPVGEALEACEVKAYGVYGRYPTAISDDGLTLFFYDSTSEEHRAAWRETPSGPFVWSVDLDDYPTARPNAACDRLYYVSGGSIEVASPN